MTKRLRPNKIRDVERTFIQAVMFEEGILPMENTAFDMRRALQQLPPEEARAMKRKFRKQWRKAMRAALPAGALTKANGQPTAKAAALKYQLGVGKAVPSRAERNARKEAVFQELWNRRIEPLVKNFENMAPMPETSVTKK